VLYTLKIIEKCKKYKIIVSGLKYILYKIIYVLEKQLNPCLNYDIVNVLFIFILLRSNQLVYVNFFKVFKCSNFRNTHSIVFQKNNAFNYANKTIYYAYNKLYSLISIGSQ